MKYLAVKADVSDISKAVTEVIEAVDNKSEIEDIKKSLNGKANKSETVS
jgi:hypothetical protein